MSFHYEKESKPVVIVIDGIIGAGKTTLIRECLLPALTSVGLKVTEVKEPVEKWKKNGRLKQFYSNPERRAYQFQTVAFHDRVKECFDVYNNCGKSTDVFILERSIFTDILFMKMLKDSKTIDSTEYDDYLKLWNMWEYVMPFSPDMFVYLRPDIEVCMDRLKNRDRDGESNISKEYQTKLLEKHDKFLGNKVVKIGDNQYVPRVLISTNDNFQHKTEVKEKITNKILGMINKIKNNR